MINIRYHIVSITAVFLALGIGVALGSTFLDRATVGRIDDNIRNAEAEIRDTRAENNQLDGVVEASEDRDEALIAATGSLLADRLEERPVLVVVAPGVDQERVDTLNDALRGTGADLRGTLALREELTFPGGELDSDLVETLELDIIEAGDARSAVYARLVAAFVRAGATVEEAEEAELPDGTQPEIITALLEEDLLGLEPGPGRDDEDPILEQGGYRYVYLTQPELDPAADQLVFDLLPAARTSPPFPVIVVSPTRPPAADDEVVTPSALDLVRLDEQRSSLYTTVDNIDTFLGVWAAVTVLADDEVALAVHYGQGEGATALSPAAR